MAKFLAIDDNPDNLISLKALIGEAFPDVAVLQSTSGPIGLELAKYEDPDVILLDIIMPGMDGFEVCRKLKSDPLLCEIPVVFLTALKGDKESRILALECGGEAFLAKPIDETELKAQLRAMLKIKQANMEKRDEKVRLAELVQERTLQLQQELEERKCIEKALRESEERFQLLFNEAPLGYQSLDIDGCFIEVNKQWLNTLGYTYDEVIGKWFGDFLSPEYRPGFRQRFPIFKAQGFIHSEFEMVHKNGEKLFIAFEGRIGYDLKGDFKQTHCILQDITQSKKAIDALKESEERFKHVFEAANVGKSITLITGEINVNLAFCEMLGYTKVELEHKKWQDITPADEIETVNSKTASLLSGEKSKTRFNKRYIHRDGSMVWADVSVALQRSQNGEPLYFITTVIDITERIKAENALNESKDNLRALLNGLPESAFLMELDGTVIAANNTVALRMGIPVEELIGKNIYQMVVPEIAELRHKFAEQMIKTKKPIQFEDERSGKTIDNRIHPVFDLNGNVNRLAIVGIDITERKQAEEKLRINEERLRNALEAATDAIWDWDVVTSEMYFSPRWFEILGYKPYEIKLNSKDWVAMAHPDDKDAALKTIYESIANGLPYEVEFRTKHADGHWVWCLVKGKVTEYDASGKPIRVSGTNSDITLRKQTEAALRESELKYRLLIENTSDVVFCVNEKGEYQFANHVFAATFDRTPNYFIGKTFWDIYPKEEADYRQATNKKVFETGMPQSIEVSVPLPNQTLYFIANANPIKDETGKVILNLTSAVDITERKMAEDQLKEMNDLLSKFISNSPIFTYIKEVSPTESRVLKASENFIDMLGIPGSQMDGKTMEELFPPEFAAKITADDWFVASQGQLIVLDEELNGRYYTTIKFPITEGKKVLLAGYTIDITQQKQTEIELRKLSMALEQSPDSILITNTKGEIEFVNPSLVKLSGFTAEELIGMNPRIFKSGETSKEEYKQLWDTIASGKVWEGELHNRKKNGELFWESATISPVFGANGKITHYLAIRKDISEQKRMTSELIQAKNQAEESDRLKSAFLANMSHEIRTPMNSIMGFASLLPEEESRELMIQYANIIVQNSEQLVSLIDSIVIYSKLQSGLFVYRPTSFDVERLLVDVQLSFNLPIYQKGVSLKCDCSLAGNIQIYTDYDKLRQIITNLITNAFKYTHQGEITLGFKLVSEGFNFYVKDTGIGIPQKDMGHVFERFFRGSNINEASTRGTGLGLSIVKELVEMIGGTIWVESEEGKGSCFYISIPF
jgi:PAS domain S-box-containing protein